MLRGEGAGGRAARTGAGAAGMGGRGLLCLPRGRRTLTLGLQRPPQLVPRGQEQRDPAVEQLLQASCRTRHVGQTHQAPPPRPPQCSPSAMGAPWPSAGSRARRPPSLYRVPGSRQPPARVAAPRACPPLPPAGVTLEHQTGVLTSCDGRVLPEPWLSMKPRMDWNSASGTFWNHFTRSLCRARISGKNFTSLSSASWGGKAIRPSINLSPARIVPRGAGLRGGGATGRHGGGWLRAVLVFPSGQHGFGCC